MIVIFVVYHIGKKISNLLDKKVRVRSVSTHKTVLIIFA